MSGVRNRLSYANVMATVAVFLALGGSAYAVSLGKNSVKSRNIAKGAVKTQDIAKGAVSRAKLQQGAIPAFALAKGSVGADALGRIVIRSRDTAVQDNTITPANPATCQQDERAVGGGVYIQNAGLDTAVQGSYPLNANNNTDPNSRFNAWTGYFLNAPGNIVTANATTYVLCLQNG